MTIRQDVTPERVFLKLRGRYAPTTAKKTMGNWRKIFLGWIGREYPETDKAAPNRKLAFAEIPFDERDYGEGINDDNSF